MGQIYSYTVHKQISDRDIDNLICTALEGGINYWCDSAEPEGADYKGCQYAHEVLTKGGALILKSFENTTHVLTLNKVMYALGKPEVDDLLDINDYDAVEVDQVIQHALFGGPIYG